MTDDNVIRLPLPNGSGVWNATEGRMITRCEAKSTSTWKLLGAVSAARNGGTGPSQTINGSTHERLVSMGMRRSIT